MYQVSPLAPSDLAALPGALPELASSPGLTLRRDGQVIAATGVQRLHAHRALGWTLTAGPCRPRGWGALLAPTLAMIETAHASGVRRLEAYVDAEHAAGLRWAQRLGFEVKALLERFTPEGRAVFLLERFG
jgi:L-amino acid N-acyltransferase YncA